MNWFEYHILKRRFTIANLHDPKAILSKKDRNVVRILIIDDNDFERQDQLRRLGFNIQKYDDIESLETAEAFHIVISDIKGVGSKFGSPQEGAFVLNQLKIKYPMKEFAVYSGSLYNTEISSSLQGINIINKDNTTDEWTNAIDSLIRKVTNPKQIWRKIAKTLIENEVPAQIIQKVEHEFVEIVLEKGGDFSGFPSKRCRDGLSSDVSGILQSLAAGIILLPFSLKA